MGHDISLNLKKQRLSCFPVLSGNVACKFVDGNLVPLSYQDGLHITHNNSKMWYLALEKIGHPVESTGQWLHKAKAKTLIPILEKLLIELTSNPDIYWPLQPEINETGERWGGYVDLCEKIQALLIACQTYPTATVEDWY